MIVFRQNLEDDIQPLLSKLLYPADRVTGERNTQGAQDLVVSAGITGSGAVQLNHIVTWLHLGVVPPLDREEKKRDRFVSFRFEID